MTSPGTHDAAGNADMRPLVKTAAAGNAGLVLFLGVLLVGGYLLFSALQSRRLDTGQPATAFDGSFGDRISSPQPLALPNGLGAQEARQPALPAAAPIAALLPPPRVITRVVEIPAPPPVAPAVALSPQAGPAVVYDSTILPRVAAAAAAADDEERVTATRFRNPSLTVPKGTVIPAVLESALDSTRPGFIRGVVSRDVMSFDGTRVLIPRGSRIYGQYASDLNYGQNRALVNWDRLLRPDGVMINLGSPAADPLGRAGVRGKVNTHFFARFGAAILQSSLDIGVGLATRQVAGDGVIVALPGSNQSIGQGQYGAGGVGQMATQGMAPVGPTLTVRQGTAVSVFVAKDLDFSTVEE